MILQQDKLSIATIYCNLTNAPEQHAYYTNFVLNLNIHKKSETLNQIRLLLRKLSMSAYAVLQHYGDSIKIGSVKIFCSPPFKFGTSSSLRSILLITRIGVYIYLVIPNLK